MLERLHVKLLISPGFLRVVRVLRIFRALRSIEQAKRIRQLLLTMIKSAPALMNVCAALFLIVFIYAVLGMTLFGHVKFQKNIINEAVNFRTFGSAICLLFRLSTSAGWNNVLGAVMVEEPKCNASLVLDGGGNGVTRGDCGDKLVAIVYFVSYIMLIGWIIISVYVAVLIENFNAAQKQDQIGITEDGMEDFYEMWQLYDPAATQFIHVDALHEFIEALDEPFKLKTSEYFEFFMTSNIAIKMGNRCHCFDVIMGLIRFHLGKRRSVLKSDEMTVVKKLEEQFNMKFPARKNAATISNTRQHIIIKTSATLVIQRVIRYYLFLANIVYIKQIMRTRRRVTKSRSYAIESLIKGLLMELVKPQNNTNQRPDTVNSNEGAAEESTIENRFKLEQ